MTNFENASNNNEEEIQLCNGNYGYYLKKGGQNYALYKTAEELQDFTLEDAKKYIKDAETKEKARDLNLGFQGRKLGENIFLNKGKYGFYLKNEGKNFSLKEYNLTDEKAEKFTLDQAKKVINMAQALHGGITLKENEKLSKTIATKLEKSPEEHKKKESDLSKAFMKHLEAEEKKNKISKKVMTN